MEFADPYPDRLRAFGIAEDVTAQVESQQALDLQADQLRKSSEVGKRRMEKKSKRKKLIVFFPFSCKGSKHV